MAEPSYSIEHLRPRAERRDSGASRAGSVISIRWHGDTDPNADRAWLVRDLVFETGKGLLAGQWGGGKTFGALDLSASVMTGLPFAGKRVVRQGGVLFVAPEGAFEIPIRLKGIVQGKLGSDAAERLPFAWIEECPRLLDADAVPQLVATAKVAAEHLTEAFDLPLALIVIDTVAAGAGFMDENSAAEAQRVMNAMEALSHQTGAFCARRGSLRQGSRDRHTRKLSQGSRCRCSAGHARQPRRGRERQQHTHGDPEGAWRPVRI